MNILACDRQIQSVLRQCGQQIQSLVLQQFAIEQKGPGDYVTDIDRLLDRQLAAAFQEMFPHDGAITEENARSRKLFHESYSRLWLIDPLDGTEDFIQGEQSYAVMVGLLQDAQPSAGWIYAPATDTLYAGGPGWGVWQVQGENARQPIAAVPPIGSPFAASMLLGDKDQANFGEAIAQILPELKFYSLGSFGLKVMEVVCGRAGLYVYLNGRVKLWDTVGPVAIAKAAGLVCCDLEGNPLSFHPDAIHPDTLAHYQPIIIGWPEYVEALRPKLQSAIASVN
ncbi:inositol monophosphatase family protein [Desertifilum sp. FACHB-1129]|uniref:3'-phosphoadenosine 5'-phosphosulfate 3'-phosphatase n=1 Tax=Desertifilum tharense IPPAS B-1220 TaxID=1781255 RepID=A0A1E5QN17_9CYAN|nr:MULTISPECIES: inositol monophosphatase family protein [Desertifilum]MDA0208863.1 inositol monophosphatase family protein [Cyanobacteria bacterium FC1]MBD2311064.1 inositol monophosphatase family protein [Desertifilum sp. FACHB-1129]MBD2321469.1 inositol monophosphatase family protein [Desertifilum sp. FACHB-866]MBD2331224.1 inositol monophosphatase family protein [Desertifilum sp. FACHB-868]OEJ76001.1 3'-phosphoadenosine 5'-phosphosulfate 3'-phosphatase [Desertifilum tharense IPPAS B-1220]